MARSLVVESPAKAKTIQKTSWNRLLPEACPVCGFPAMAEEVREGGNTVVVCARKGARDEVAEDAGVTG